MAKAVTPSESTSITAGQIGKVQELLGAALRKSGLLSNPTQQVLEHQGDELAREFVAVLRMRVEAVSNVITRRAKVDRAKSPQEALDTTGRKQYTNREVVAAMPRGEGDEAEVVFFKPDPSAFRDGLISANEVARQFELRGLNPDPYGQAAVNEADPAFADKYPNGT